MPNTLPAPCKKPLLGTLVACLLLFTAAAHGTEIHHVVIKDMAFSPAALEVHTGDIVEWKNEDFVDHTATANDKAFNIVIPAHKSGKVVVGKARPISYYCRYHPMMKGRIVAQ